MSGLDPEPMADAALALHNTGPAQVVAAAATIAELVRRMNHATLPGTQLQPAELDSVLASLDLAAGRLEQLMGQLADVADQLAWHQWLYDAEDRQRERPGDVAIAAAAYLRVNALNAAARLRLALSAAQRRTARLGLREPAEPAEAG